MKTILLWIILFSPVASFAQQEISFMGASPKAGQTYVRTSTYKMDVDVIFKFAGESLGEHNEVSTFTVRKAETVLEARGDAITRLQVRYEAIDRKSVITEDGIPINEPEVKSPVLGKTYTVTVQDGKINVIDQHQLKPSPDELEIVEKDYEELGQPDSFLQFLKQKTIQVGEPLQMPGILAEGIFTDSERRHVKVNQASFVLKNTSQNIAHFDTALKMQWNEDANTSIKMNLTGETLIGVQTSRMVSSTLGGTVRVTGTDQLYNRLVMVDGKGKITITESVKLKP